MIYSIIKTKGTPRDRYEYFQAYDAEHHMMLMKTFIESKFYCVEPRKIVNLLMNYEYAIDRSNIASDEEQRILKEYYDYQADDSETMTDKEKLINTLTQLSEKKAVSKQEKSALYDAIYMIDGKSASPNRLSENEYSCGACGNCLGEYFGSNYCLSCGVHVDWP